MIFHNFMFFLQSRRGPRAIVQPTWPLTAALINHLKYYHLTVFYNFSSSSTAQTKVTSLHLMIVILIIKTIGYLYTSTQLLLLLGMKIARKRGREKNTICQFYNSCCLILIINHCEKIFFRYYLSSAVCVCVCVCMCVCGCVCVCVCVYYRHTVQPRTFKLWHNIPYVNI